MFIEMRWNSETKLSISDAGLTSDFKTEGMVAEHIRYLAIVPEAPI